MTKKCVVLVSGGIDSTTVLAVAKNQGFESYALSFDYGQRHIMELERARSIAEHFHVQEHKIARIDLRIFGGSALTDTIDVPKGRSIQTMSSEIPVTYVPARNTIFLSYALAWAEVLKAYDIFIGVNALDYSGYPDCRPAYIEAFQEMANLATKEAVEGRKITIHAPLISMTKAEIIKLGVALGVDYSMTLSCYDPSAAGLSCGVCDSCSIRRMGFLEAGVEDPTAYA